MNTPALNAEMMQKMVENDVEHWKLTRENDPDLDPALVARDLCEHTGYLQRFGETPKDPKAEELLRDRELLEMALESFEKGDELSKRVEGFLSGEGGDEYEDRAGDILIDRDRAAMAIRTLERHLPKDKDLQSRLAQVDYAIQQLDGRMRAASEKFSGAAGSMGNLRELYGDDKLSPDREWWFFELSDQQLEGSELSGRR